MISNFEMNKTTENDLKLNVSEKNPHWLQIINEITVNYVRQWYLKSVKLNEFDVISLRSLRALYFNCVFKNWAQKLHCFLAFLFKKKNKPKNWFREIEHIVFVEYIFPLPLEFVPFEISIKIMIWKHWRQPPKINGFIASHIDV